jgi:uncharacterized membrane protein YqaE (UPF0057 family)
MDNKTLLIILSIFIPPAAVYMKDGNKVTNNFWINLVLWLFTWVGGVIHALYLVLK